MLRDFKFLRRNSGKNDNTEEVENVPLTLNPRDNLNPKISTDPSRPPLNTIHEPARIPKSTSDHDSSKFKPNKVNRTPTKPKHKYSDTPIPLRTPDKQGTLSKKRVNWAQKGVHTSSNDLLEPKEEGRVLLSHANTSTSARGAVARANLSYSECNSTQTTPTKSVSKPPNPGFSSSSGSRTVSNMGARMANYAALSKGVPSSCNLPAVVNTVEVPCFELEEDPSFWMEHNVQVLIRVRPLNNMEKSSFGYSRCLKQESGQSITWIGQPETRFMYDHVACEAIDQETLFGMVGLPMVENCLSGYNSCMFAYGQTGSGKTHTMLGEIEKLEVKPSPNRGMTPRIFEFLFARIREEQEIRRDEQLKYNCKCSFLEIYNEQITDLLDPSSTNLMLREDMKKGVYVENLSEFEVHTVGDILQLLTQGASNRKVAATNMNRESSRSHSVFTCVIESTWEKDSVSNFRFARLNLVDLAGSERQKSSGAEGERLKEAANINKSLSTLGHVIMVLVDVANGKPRHIPYRDSRLTFLLQDSLGGNSKTMIIANVSPSIRSAAETLNTLKFAQRAKLIQNNAVINEDSSGDVVALKYQIQLLKEELSALKREKVTRSLSIGESFIDTSIKDEDDDCSERTHVKENGVLRVSCKQLRSLETTLAGALRREQMAETTVQQLQAEIHQLNRLVSQREEDTRCRKMMVKFREDKIQRMESVLGGMMPMDDYLVTENKALTEENQLLRERVDKNPEVTRFAVENIRLIDQVRQFQDLYEEGEKEMLMNEVCQLRNQLISSLENLKHPNHLDKEGSDSNDNENNFLHEELKITLSELEGSKEKLNYCLEENTKLQREIEELHASLSATTQETDSTTQETDSSAEVLKESIVGVPMINNLLIMTTGREKEGTRSESHVNVEDIMALQLELDIVKFILQEQRSSHVETEEMAKSLNRELQLSKETVISFTKDYEQLLEELEKAKHVIGVFESQQILMINNIDEKELEISNVNHVESDDSHLEAKLRKMHRSLEKAKKLNMFYRSDIAAQASNEQEAEEVRKHVEAETAEVIIYLQKALAGLQQEVYDIKAKEMETSERLMLLETMREEWDGIVCEMDHILSGGDESLRDASDQINFISGSIPNRRSLVSETGKMKKYIFEKEASIEELRRCLKEALNKRDDMECMLTSLRGAALVMTEAHQQECCEKNKEIFRLTSEINSKASTVEELQSLIEHGKDQLKTASSCATAAFVVVNRLWESNCNYRALVIDGAENKGNNEIFETREKLKELNYGVSEIKLGVNDYVKLSGCKLSRTGIRTEEDTEDVNSVNLSSKRAVSSVNGRDDSIILLKKEIEFGLKRLQEVQGEIDKLRFEKEEVLASEKTSRKRIDSTINQAVILADAIENFRDEFEIKVDGLEVKIEKLEEIIQQSSASWFLQRDLLEDEIGGAINIAAQKTIEASCILEKFEEVQDNAKEADIMINELMIANEALKLNAHESKARENNLTVERDIFAKEVKCLEKQYGSDFDIMSGTLSELENVISEIQTASINEWMSVSSDLFTVKSQFQESTMLIRIMLEEVWSEIIAKDCAMSVLHLCHMGILLYTANGLNKENNLLECGLCKSNSVVSELREHNLKSINDLEMCRVLKGKLLTDITRGFILISSKVDENGEVSLKLACFEKKIQNLQYQEEMLLGTSNDMGSELAMIMKELDLCYKCTVASIMDYESLLKEKDDLIQFECVGNIALKLDSETSRNDDILKGILFDLGLLQESDSNSKEKKDEMKDVLDSLSVLKRDYELNSFTLEKAVAEGQSLEARLQEKIEKLSVLELDLSRGQDVINLSSKNAEVLDGVKEALDAKNSMEKDLLEARIKIEDLETEVAEMEMVLGQMSKTTDSLKGDMDSVKCQRDELGSKVIILSKELETARALAEVNAAIAIEAQEKAEIQKVNAEEKEEEVRLLERSIEELEFTINVLEQKVDIVKGEAERQRRQRDELELELLGFKEQMQNIKSNDSDLKRCLDEKEMNHKESLLRVKLLEKEIAARDAEISQCKAHICELNLHAEAQASEHKQRFKALEAMVEKLKAEVSTTHGTSSPKIMEKIPSKSRGSGSPFKCIGLGLVQQIKSEKDEELTAGRQRIEELEDLATSRQKEILMLKARLASTESMTHDVIRDLLGVKLNMKNYANLMDNQQLHSLVGKAQHHNVDAEVKDQQVANLKVQIHEFVKERNGWLEEIERKQAEMMSAHVALEKLRQQEQLLATENDMLKLENANHKKKVMELEVEVTNLSGQQNIQQRIHHHAKIKEENNSLRFHNEELRFKLRRTESILLRVKDELAQFRAANGKSPYINFDEEEQLDKKLKETKEEKVQLAQKLLGLCTTVLKAAGITKPTSEISITVAEVVLVQLKNKIVSLEMELEDVKLKSRISNERIRLSELQTLTSTESSSRADMIRNRASQKPTFSALDR